MSSGYHDYRYEWYLKDVTKVGEILDWIQDNIGMKGWDFSGNTFMFKRETDYVLFLMRWS